MAYTQKPGSPAKKKTGQGIPSVLLQKKNISSGEMTKEEGLNNLYATSEINKKRIGIEALAKKDSIAAAGSRKLSGGNKLQQGLQGNLAANKTRAAGGAGDMRVMRGTEFTGDSGYGDTPTSEGRKTSYTRNKPVEKEFAKKDIQAYAFGKGELPNADTATIKAINEKFNAVASYKRR